MAILDEVFDSSTVEDTSGNFEPLPAGDYVIQITADEMKDTKAGNGKMLNLTTEVLDGEFAGRKLWCRINYRNANAQAQAIGHELFKKIVIAVTGHDMQINDTAILHYKPFIASVKLKPGRDGYGPSNEIAKCRGIANDNAPAKPANRAPAAAGRPAAAPAAAAGGSRPWPTRTA